LIRCDIVRHLLLFIKFEQKNISFVKTICVDINNYAMKIKLPDFLETAIVKMAISKSGPLVTKGVTALVASAVAILAQKLPGVEVYLNEYVLTGILWVLVDYAYGLVPANISKKYGKEIQQMLNDAGATVDVDGYVGPQTVQAATNLKS